MRCRQTAAFLGVFAITAPLGVGIGIALEDINAGAQMVLYALATGFFIYVGASEVHSFSSCTGSRACCFEYMSWAENIGNACSMHAGVCDGPGNLRCVCALCL